MVDIAAVLPGQGLAFDGQPHEDSDEYQVMLDAARDWLIAQGHSRRRAEHLTAWRPGLVASDAHIGEHPTEEGLHFMQADHEGARPVTVVHVPVPWEEIPAPPLPPRVQTARRRGLKRVLSRFPERA